MGEHPEPDAPVLADGGRPETPGPIRGCGPPERLRPPCTPQHQQRQCPTACRPSRIREQDPEQWPEWAQRKEAGQEARQGRRADRAALSQGHQRQPSRAKGKAIEHQQEGSERPSQHRFAGSGQEPSRDGGWHILAEAREFQVERWLERAAIQDQPDAEEHP